MILSTQFQLEKGLSPHQQQAIVQAPTECPTVWLNSGTLRLDIASDSTVQGFSTTRFYTPPSGSSCKPRLLPVLQTKSELPKTLSLGSINLLEWLTELKEIFYLLVRSPIYYKKIELRNSQMEDRHRARFVGRGTELPLPLYACHSVLVSMWSPTQKFSERCPFGFLWKPHYIGTID